MSLHHCSDIMCLSDPECLTCSSELQPDIALFTVDASIIKLFPACDP